MASVWPSLVPAASSRVPAAMQRSRLADLSPIWIQRGISVRPCCEHFVVLSPDASMAMVVAADRDRCWGWDMKILIFGGTGFVGLNIAAALLVRGHAVTLFDRANLRAAGQHDFAGYREALTVGQGDITDRQTVTDVVAGGHDAIVLGAAITAGPARDAADPESIMQVNLLAQLPVLVAAWRGSSICHPARPMALPARGTPCSTKRRPAIPSRSMPSPNLHPRELPSVWLCSGTSISSVCG